MPEAKCGANKIRDPADIWTPLYKCLNSCSSQAWLNVALLLLCWISGLLKMPRSYSLELFLLHFKWERGRNQPVLALAECLCFPYAIITFHQFLRQMLTCSFGVTGIPLYWCHIHGYNQECNPLFSLSVVYVPISCLQTNMNFNVSHTTTASTPAL